MRVLTIVGARPQFIKAAAVSKELRKNHKEILLHTGQHYDYEMSGIFFEGLEMPRPDVNLDVRSSSHGAQTGSMLKGIEEVLMAEQPDYLLIYGDTNSTLAGALAGAKLSVPVVHIEAGLRSFNRHMPEEINRVVADHLSELLLCPSDTAVQNLAVEGITRNVHQVGDVMLDVLDWARQRISEQPSKVLQKFDVQNGRYLLATVHRSENTDDVSKLAEILKAFNSIQEPVVFPVHPRARKAVQQAGLEISPNIRLTEPVGYMDMIALAASARMILTDSGGLQKEAYWLKVPCITLREETEWVETVNAGWNVLVGSNSEKIIHSVRSFTPNGTYPKLYGDGFAASRCVNLLG